MDHIKATCPYWSADDPQGPKRPMTKPSYIHCHISPFGVIPKKVKPGKWRLIVNLSSPMNASVNDGIDRDISYITIDQVVDVIVQLGQGTLMAKVDIKQTPSSPRRPPPVGRPMGRSSAR